MSLDHSHHSTPSGSADIIGLHDLTVAREFEPLLKANRLDRLDALFSVDAMLLSKPGLTPGRERLRVTMKQADRDLICYLKRYQNARPVAVARHWTSSRSRAGVEWSILTQLHAAQIPCPRPIAFGEEVDRGKEERSAIFIAEVPGKSLEAWFAGTDPLLFRPGKGGREVRDITRQVARLVARFHGKGFIHRDLYLSHVFWDPDAPPEGSLHLIDVQRVERPAFGRDRKIIKDLAALNYSAPSAHVSRADRMRFLKEYLGTARLDDAARRLAYRVLGKTLSIRRHDAKRSQRMGKVGSNP